MRYGQNSELVHMNATFFNETFALAFERLLTKLSNPMKKVEGETISSDGRSLKLLKSALPVSQIVRYAKRNPFTMLYLETFRRISNFTLRCPVQAGQYFVALNTFAIQKLFPLHLMYKSKSVLRGKYDFREEKPKRKITCLVNTVVQYIIVPNC